MPATIKLVQLNIERSKHIDLIIPFLKTQNPDVITFQELMERDLPRLKQELGMEYSFAPMTIQDGGVQGVGIFSKTGFVTESVEQYGGVFSGEIPTYIHDENDRDLSYNTSRFTLLTCEIQKDDQVFRVATTHFPVSVGGKTSDFQLKDLHNLLPLLEKKGELVMAGDLNAPRGGEIFSAIAGKYKDNIPQDCVMSLDVSLHRAGREKLENNAKEIGMKGFMVDGIFSTPGYEVSNVGIHFGLSDHCAFTAEISKARK